MAQTQHFLYQLSQNVIEPPYRPFALATAVLTLVVWMLWWQATRYSDYPVINKPRFWWTNQDAKAKYIVDAKSLIQEGFHKFTGPFKILTDHGPLIMLSPEYIDAVNREPNLSFRKYIERENLCQYDTFRVFRQLPPGLFTEAVTKGLTRNLPKLTKILPLEMSSCLKDTWGQPKDWHRVMLRDDVLIWVARLSSRVFTGELLHGNAEWMRICVDYTTTIFASSMACKRFPPGPLQWLAVALLPSCRKARADYRSGSAILAPIFAERNLEIAAAQQEGRKPNVPDDSIEWCRNASRGREYNEVDMQFALAMGAVHTTSDLLTQAVLNLCAHPDLVEPLRREVVDVLKKYGWQKVALTEMRLLDSFFKETQRLKPINISTMRRLAVAPVELPNGTKIRKGDSTAISAHLMWSPQEYKDPEKFDAYRYLHRRALPGYENSSLLVSTGPSSLGFSYGKHACPGRFFAANKVKIAMVYTLLKYDMKVADAKVAQWYAHGMDMFANPGAEISVRIRQPELDLDELARELS